MANRLTKLKRIRNVQRIAFAGRSVFSTLFIFLTVLIWGVFARLLFVLLTASNLDMGLLVALGLVGLFGGLFLGLSWLLYKSTVDQRRDINHTATNIAVIREKKAAQAGSVSLAIDPISGGLTEFSGPSSGGLSDAMGDAVCFDFEEELDVVEVPHQYTPHHNASQ